MQFTSGDLKVLQYGVAARLGIKAEGVRVLYASSTYAGAPEGIVDESESLRVDLLKNEEHLGATIAGYWAREHTVEQVADRYATMFHVELLG